MRHNVGGTVIIMHGLKLKRRSRPQFYAPLAQEKAILQTKNIEGWNRIHNFPQLEMIAKWPNRSTEYHMFLQACEEKSGKRPSGHVGSCYKAK